MMAVGDNSHASLGTAVGVATGEEGNRTIANDSTGDMAL